MKLIIFLVTIAICFHVILKDFPRGRYYRPIWVLVFLLTNGLQIVPSPGGTLSYLNFGMVAMIFMYFICFTQNIRLKTSRILKWYKYFIIYFIGCVLFSWLYYKFAPFEIFRVIKSVVPFAAVFLFGLLSNKQTEKMLDNLLKITVILNILYIVQAFTGIVILTYFVDSVSAGDAGLYRFYNKPILSNFFLLWLIFKKGLYGKVFTYSSIILMLASLLLSQNRMEIISVIVVYSVCSIIQRRNNIGKVIFRALLLVLLYKPVSMVFSMRDNVSYNTMSTSQDIENVIHGGYKDMSAGDGTFTFRFAMFYERLEYMKDVNVFRQFFGLGLGHSEYVENLYHFKIGTFRADGGVSQLSSADFSWIQMICWWGFGGTFLFLVIFCKELKFFYKFRGNTMSLVAFGYLLFIFIGSLGGSGFAEAQYHLLPFMAMFYQYQLNNDRVNEDCTHRIGTGQPNA